MDANDIYDGGAYSADVRMELRINGSVIPIAQMASDFIIVRTPLDYPPTDAEIFMSIDGRPRHWNVSVPDGLNRNRERTRIVPGTDVPSC